MAGATQRKAMGMGTWREFRSKWVQTLPMMEFCSSSVFPVAHIAAGLSGRYLKVAGMCSTGALCQMGVGKVFARVAAVLGLRAFLGVSLALSFLGSRCPIPTPRKSTGRWFCTYGDRDRSCVVAAKGMMVHPGWHSLLCSGLKYVV